MAGEQTVAQSAKGPDGSGQKAGAGEDYGKPVHIVAAAAAAGSSLINYPLILLPFFSATDFLMESPRRNRFIVSVDKEFPKRSFVPVITCSDDVPRMVLLAQLPPLGSVAAGAIAGLFSRKLELCCLQALKTLAFIFTH